MHSPEYTQKIKDLLFERKVMDDSLARCVYAFRNGRKPSTIELNLAKESFTNMVNILEKQEEL